LGLAGLTRHVARLHRVPRFGDDPFAWLDAALEVLGSGDYDVLVPTHEQATVLALASDRVRQLGVGLAVPHFDAMLRVQDKIAQSQTLTELGLPQPSTQVLADRDLLLANVEPPVFLKAPIGTASSTVLFVPDVASLDRAVSRLMSEGALEDGGIVAQARAEGPILMLQSVFDDGRLIAWHGNLRLRPGPNGGSSAKLSVRPAQVQEHLQTLGEGLGWHGALSLDAVMTPAGPRYIDINPRIVEPANAWYAGVDLVETLLAVSAGRSVQPAAPTVEGVRTHQLLLAILASAENGRRAIARELLSALTGRGPYQGSIEELTPAEGDGLALLPVAVAASATFVAPSCRRWFTDGAVSNYALTPSAWRAISAQAAPPWPHQPPTEDHHHE
jgi:hypothetical protein